MASYGFGLIESLQPIKRLLVNLMIEAFRNISYKKFLSRLVCQARISLGQLQGTRKDLQEHLGNQVCLNPSLKTVTDSLSPELYS